jgi:acyl carrier protein
LRQLARHFKMMSRNMNAIDQSRTAFRCPLKQRHFDLLFARREPLQNVKLWERCFSGQGVALDTVTRIMRILSDILEVDLFRIRPPDSFSHKLSFFWDFDSLADLKIMHALEEEFKIRISDAEAEGMKTFGDIVLGVHAKISAGSG